MNKYKTTLRNYPRLLYDDLGEEYYQIFEYNRKTRKYEKSELQIKTEESEIDFIYNLNSKSFLLVTLDGKISLYTRINQSYNVEILGEIGDGDHFISNRNIITKKGKEIIVYRIINDKLQQIQTFFNYLPFIKEYQTNKMILYNDDSMSIYQFNSEKLKYDLLEAMMIRISSIMDNGDILYISVVNRRTIYKLYNSDQYFDDEPIIIGYSSFYVKEGDNYVFYTKRNGKYVKLQTLGSGFTNDSKPRRIGYDMFMTYPGDRTSSIWIKDTEMYKKIQITNGDDIDISITHHLYPSDEEIERNKSFLAPLIPINISLVGVITKFL